MDKKMEQIITEEIREWKKEFGLDLPTDEELEEMAKYYGEIGDEWKWNSVKLKKKFLM